MTQPIRAAIAVVLTALFVMAVYVLWKVGPTLFFGIGWN